MNDRDLHEHMCVAWSGNERAGWAYASVLPPASGNGRHLPAQVANRH